MRQEHPRWLAHGILRGFVRIFHIDVREAEHPLSSYQSVHEFFTRRLKPGARTIEADWVHPVDGQLVSVHQIVQGQTVLVKGAPYSVEELIGERDESLEGGLALLYYLAPHNYHRVHVPTTAQLELCRHLGGDLWPVNTWGVNRVTHLFSKNERVSMRLRSLDGEIFYQVMVGALNVGQIEIVLDSRVHTQLPESHSSHFSRLWQYDPPFKLRCGDELGVFHMGSSVVLLVSKRQCDRFQIRLDAICLGKVRMGASLQTASPS